MKKGLSTIIVIGVVVAVMGVLAAVGWYYMDQTYKTDKANLQAQIDDLSAKKSDDTDSTSKWKTYTNGEVGFSFKYPENWVQPELVKHVVNADVGSGVSFANYNDNGPIKADPYGIFSFLVDSKGYNNMYGDHLFGTAIDPSWTQEQFSANIMKNFSGKLEFYKQLDKKTILIGYYENIECSQSLTVQVITPLNDAYPNFVISVNGNYGNDPIIAAAESNARSNNQDVCGLEPAFKQVADKVLADTYSGDVSRGIETARLIANSLTVK